MKKITGRHPITGTGGWLANLTTKTSHLINFILSLLLIFPLTTIGQSGDLDQVRNGPANNPSKNFYSTFDNPTWVNGNAGASNAHYVEGMSIAYRSLLTGVTNGSSYEYIIEYDTKHSGRMAIDYLTHYQRLEPHGPFGHAAEVLDPRIFKSGSKEYLIGLVSTNTFAIPAPFQSPANTPVAGMPQNSFNALPAAERLMTIYNGVITSITYDEQQALTLPSNTITKVRIQFTAESDSVVLAWGGHIGSRLDWGYLEDGITPRSASGISGSPYHMRQKSMNTFPGLVTISGVGNQDRSLSAAAVIPPPDCSISPAQLACPETASLVYNYTGTSLGAIFLWEVNAGNTAGAQISGSATGTSVTIVPIGADFIPGGTFNLSLTVTENGIPITCMLSQAGTIQNVQVTATANPTTIDFAVGNTSQLNATASPAPNTNYSFSWTQDPAGGGSLSAANIANPVFTATAPGVFTFIVTATQLAAPNCSAKDTVVVTAAASQPPCSVTGPSTICPGSTNVYNGPGGSIPDNFTYTWALIENTNNASISGATNGTSVTVIAGTACNTGYIVHLHIESNSGLIQQDCYDTVSVEDNTPPVITFCPADMELECDADTAASNTGTATATDNCSAEVTYSDEVTSKNCFTYITRTWTATDPCGNTSTCKQTIILVDRTAPAFTCQANIEVACGDPIPTPPVTDNCSLPADITILYSDAVAEASGCEANPYNLNRTWKAIDASGNISTCTQHITFTAPVVEASKNTPVTSEGITVLQNAILPESSVNDIRVRVYPNPYSNEVNFRFVSPVSGQVTLEIYNIDGARIAVINKGNVIAGSANTIQYSVPALQQGTLVYKLSVGSNYVHGKLLPGRAPRFN